MRVRDRTSSGAPPRGGWQVPHRLSTGFQTALRDASYLFQVRTGHRLEGADRRRREGAAEAGPSPQSATARYGPRGRGCEDFSLCLTGACFCRLVFTARIKSGRSQCMVCINLSVIGRQRRGGTVLCPPLACRSPSQQSWVGKEGGLSPSCSPCSPAAGPEPSLGDRASQLPSPAGRAGH